MLKKLIVIICAIIIAIGAVACEKDAPVGAPACKERFFTPEQFAAADYRYSTWYAPDNTIMGYSRHENSRVYNIMSCAQRNSFY